MRGLPAHGVAPEPKEAAWDILAGPLGFVGTAEGKRVNARADAPPLAGLVEQTGPSEYPQLLLRLDEPAPGLAQFFALAMGGKVYVIARFYLFGSAAAAVTAREQAKWQSWLVFDFRHSQEGSGIAVTLHPPSARWPAMGGGRPRRHYSFGGDVIGFQVRLSFAIRHSALNAWIHSAVGTSTARCTQSACSASFNSNSA